MSIRRQRTHWTGKSNRQRAKKYPEVDEMEVERMKGDLKISDQDFAATNNGWAKSIKIFEEPSIIRTRLGGTLFRPLSRCDSKQYIDVLEHYLNKNPFTVTCNVTFVVIFHHLCTNSRNKLRKTLFFKFDTYYSLLFSSNN